MQLFSACGWSWMLGSSLYGCLFAPMLVMDLWHYGIDYMSGFCLVFYFYPWEWWDVLRELQFLTCRGWTALLHTILLSLLLLLLLLLLLSLFTVSSGIWIFKLSFLSNKIAISWKKINGLKYMTLWYTNVSSLVLIDCKNWTMSYWMHEETWNKIQFFVTE